MKRLNKKLQQFWAQEKSLTILLLILVVHIFIIIPLGEKTIFSKIIFLIFYFSLLSAGMFLLIKNGRLRSILIFMFALLVFLSSGILFHSVPLEVVDDLVALMYTVLLSSMVLLRTFSEGPVTIHRIQGAILAYLLISFVFAIVYHSFYLIEGEQAFKGLSSYDRKEFMYFSLTTLTTVGYGDISAALPFNRSLANLEALIGQLYPAILIARLVSMEFESSKSKTQS
jgi:hypothetical protein